MWEDLDGRKAENMIGSDFKGVESYSYKQYPRQVQSPNKHELCRSQNC